MKRAGSSRRASSPSRFPEYMLLENEDAESERRGRTPHDLIRHRDVAVKEPVRTPECDQAILDRRTQPVLLLIGVGRRRVQRVQFILELPASDSGLVSRCHLLSPPVRIRFL